MRIECIVGKLNAFLFSCIILSSLSCATIPVTREIREVHEASKLNPRQFYLKAHMLDGTVYILHKWKITADSAAITASGKQLDINRRLMRNTAPSNSYGMARQFTIPMDSIALFETNQVGESIAGGLGIVTGIVGLTALVCIINPKACFGSCPTFYAFDGDTMTIMAEGFSSSIAPSLEDNDIDMLYAASPANPFELHLTNEALETHSIQYANLLVCPRGKAERVFISPVDSFYQCQQIQEPLTCESETGDCLQLIRAVDHHEYFSLSDGENLNSREELLLTLDIQSDDPHGLIIGKRQTIMTTYLMYQGLAYMGGSVSYWLAALERGVTLAKNDVFNILGGIEVFCKNAAGEWILQGEIRETGPIATDFKIVPLPDARKGKAVIKLRLNKGLWRVDYIATATMGPSVMPTVVTPARVNKVTGVETNPLRKLHHPDEYLVTYPGDTYTLQYDLPETNCEIFLDSRGFYLEWIRDQWVAEQNFIRLNQFINKPEKFLKQIAPAYKLQEPTMEETFWNSRYEK